MLPSTRTRRGPWPGAVRAEKPAVKWWVVVLCSVLRSEFRKCARVVNAFCKAFRRVKQLLFTVTRRAEFRANAGRASYELLLSYDLRLRRSHLHSLLPQMHTSPFAPEVSDPCFSNYQIHTGFRIWACPRSVQVQYDLRIS